MRDVITLAKLGAPFGVNGWIKLHSFAHPENNILNYSRFFIQQGKAWQPIDIKKIKPHGKGFIAKISGVEQPEEVKMFTHCLVGVNRSELPELETGEHYWNDLIGLSVKNEQGDDLGKVDSLFSTGANDVLIIKDRHLKEHLLPYTDEVVKNVDLSNRLIRVDWDPEF